MFYFFLFLLIWTPWVFGSVHAMSYSLLELSVFLIVAVWMFQMAFSRRVRTPRQWIWTPFAVPVALFLLLLVLQLLPLPLGVLDQLSPMTADLYRQFRPDWADAWMPLSLNQYATHIALLKLLAYTGVFFWVVNTVRTRRQIRIVCWVIVSVATSMAIFGIGQKYTGANVIHWFRDASLIGNAFGPYVNGNHFAAYQVMAILLGLGLLLWYQPFGRDEGRQSSQPAPTRVVWAQYLLLAGCLFAMVCALVMSRSRGGFLALLCGLAAFAVLQRLRPGRRRRQRGTAAVMVALAGVLLVFGGPLLIRFVNLATGDEALPWAGRLAVFEATWHMVKDFPLFGVGYEAYASIFPRYQLPAAFHLTYAHAHNDVLQLLAETGWVGWTLAVGGFMWSAWRVVRHWRQRRDAWVQVMVPACLAACLAIGAHSFVDFNLHIPANALVATTIFALMFACVNVSRRDGSSGRDDTTWQPGIWHRAGRRFTPLVVLGVVLWCSAAAVQVGVADSFYPQQRLPYHTHWTNQGSAAVRVPRLQHALVWTPDNPFYLVSLAELNTYRAWAALREKDLSEEARRQEIALLQETAGLYEHALRQSPTDPDTQLSWLRNLLFLRALKLPLPPHRQGDMLAQCEHVATLAPAYPQLQFGLGDILLYAQERSGKHDALPFFRRAVRLDAQYEPLVWKSYERALPETEALQNFARTMPNTAEGHLKMARVLQDTHWRQARLHYRAALALEASNPDILRAYGTVLMRHKNFKTAQQMWARLMRLEPEQPYAYLQMLSASRALKDDAGIAKMLQQAVAHFPRRVDFAEELAQLYLRLGKTREAEGAWQHVVDLQPDAPGAYQQLARLYEQHGKRDQALQAYLKLANFQPDDAKLLFKIGEYYLDNGNTFYALQYFGRAAKLKPGNPQFQQALEKALEQREQKNQ